MTTTARDLNMKDDYLQKLIEAEKDRLLDLSPGMTVAWKPNPI
jgi:hypothetical protein